MKQPKTLKKKTPKPALTQTTETETGTETGNGNRNINRKQPKTLKKTPKPALHAQPYRTQRMGGWAAGGRRVGGGAGGRLCRFVSSRETEIVVTAAI